MGKTRGGQTALKTSRNISEKYAKIQSIVGKKRTLPVPYFLSGRTESIPPVINNVVAWVLEHSLSLLYIS